MAMYNYNGTTSKPMDKGYNYNGTTSKQLGQGYNYNGTTSKPIYTAEENVLRHGVSHYSGGSYVLHGNMSFDGSSVTLHANSQYGYSGGIVNAYTSSPFDLSEADTLTFTLSTTADENTQRYTSIYVGVVRAMPTADGSWLPAGWQSANVANSMRVINAKEWASVLTSGFSGTYTMNVSGLSGAHYVTFCVTNSYNYDSSANATFTNVILS